MKPLLLLALLFLCAAGAVAQTNAPAPTSVTEEQKKPLDANGHLVQSRSLEIWKQARAKHDQGKTAEVDYAEQFQAIDDLEKTARAMTAEPAQKKDYLAACMVLRVLICELALHDEVKAAPFLKELHETYAGTEAQQDFDSLWKRLAPIREAEAIQARQKIGAVLPDFKETTSDGKPIALSDYQGKVLLLDYGLAWDDEDASRRLLALYQKYHAAGFEIVEIATYHDPLELKEAGELSARLKLPWPLVPAAWRNGPLPPVLMHDYGVEKVPSGLLIDREGKLVGRNLSPQAVDEAVAKLMEAKEN